MTIEFDGQNNKITRDTAGSIKVDRKTSDGDIIELQKDGTTVGSIGVASSDLNIYGDVGIKFSGDDVRPTDSSGNNSDNAVDLGHFDVRWQDLYLGGNIYLGGTGSANALDDYEEGTWTPTYSSAGGLPSSVTYDRRNGYYYKIGGVVHVWWTLRTDAINTTGMSGDLHVSGLPFNAGGSTDDSVIAGGDAIVDNFLNDTVLTKTGALDNASTIVFFVEGSHAGTDATTVLKNAGNANSMYGHMTYFVDF